MSIQDRFCHPKMSVFRAFWIWGLRRSNCQPVLKNPTFFSSQGPNSCHCWVTNLGLSSYFYSPCIGAGPVAEAGTSVFLLPYFSFEPCSAWPVAPLSYYGSEWRRLLSSLGFVSTSPSSRGNLSPTAPLFQGLSASCLIYSRKLSQLLPVTLAGMLVRRTLLLLETDETFLGFIQVCLRAAGEEWRGKSSRTALWASLPHSRVSQEKEDGLQHQQNSRGWHFSGLNDSQWQVAAAEGYPHNTTWPWDNTV